MMLARKTGSAFMPKLALVTNHSPQFQSQARQIGERLQQKNVRFDMVFLDDPRCTRIDGCVREVRLGKCRARASVARMTRYLREEKPALTLAAPSHVAPFVIVAGLLARRTVVPWERGFNGYEQSVRGQHRFIPRAQVATYRFAPRVVVPHADVARHLAEDLGITVEPFIAPNPVDREAVRRASQPPEVGGASFRMCAVGRLVRGKAIDVLLEALAQAAPELPGRWELEVVGEGPQAPALRRQALSLSLEDRVHFRGWLRNPYPVIASSDALIHPSRWEAFGLVLVEALSLGVPVIATNGPGAPREILADGKFGLLVPPGDPESLARAIVTLAHDRSLRETLRERAEEGAARYQPNVIAERLLTLVTELADGGRSPNSVETQYR
jgi:glycosyltransferase involved in cell wall biosynthesis